jgi:hypothetical protein
MAGESQGYGSETRPPRASYDGFEAARQLVASAQKPKVSGWEIKFPITT